MKYTNQRIGLMSYRPPAGAWQDTILLEHRRTEDLGKVESGKRSRTFGASLPTFGQ